MRSATLVLACLMMPVLATAPLASGADNDQAVSGSTATPGTGTAGSGAAAAPAPVQYAPDYQIGPGDQLSISVSGLREFDQTVRVSNSGRVHVPYVGVMMAAGMTPLELEREIASQIALHELVLAPEVRVHIQRFSARPAYVIGDVRRPGQFVITGEVFVLDLLTRAGGLLPSAEDTAILYRRTSSRPVVQTRLLDSADVAPSSGSAGAGDSAGGGGEQVIRLNLEALTNGSSSEMNVGLQGGDVLFVPRRAQRNIFVIGQVITPGVYTLPRRGTVTAAQAIIYAGGPTDTAGTGSAFVMRHDAQGNQVELLVDFPAILEGREEDIPVQANDIIFVPNSAIKTFGVGLLRLGPRALQQFLIF